MSNRNIWKVFVAAPLAVAVGTIVLTAGEPSTAAKQSEKVFSERLLEIATQYQPWGRIVEQPKFAPVMCAAPPPPAIVMPKISASDDKSTHGRKLYHLFAKDKNEYLQLTDKSAVILPQLKSLPPSDIGQVIVKESWTMKPAEDVKLDGNGQPPAEVDKKTSERFSPHAQHDGKWFKMDQKSALFIMFRVDPATPGTDDGWVYGTVTPDGNKVTSVGLVQSCMECHKQAPHGRLFGLTKTAN